MNCKEQGHGFGKWRQYFRVIIVTQQNPRNTDRSTSAVVEETTKVQEQYSKLQSSKNTVAFFFY